MADQANIPSQGDLNSLYGDNNVMSYIQGYRNQDLASQFRDQAYQQQQNATQKGTLENQQSTSMNPLLLEQQRGVNQGRDYENVVKGNTAELSTANQSNMLSKQQRQAALDASEDDMKQFDVHVRKMLTSPNSAERDQGAQMQQYLSSFQLERRAAKDKMELQKEQSRSHLSGIGMQTGAQERMNTANINAGKFTKRGAAGVQNIQDSVQSGKMTAEKAAVALHAAAQFAEDPDTAQKYTEMAQQYEQFAMQQRNAAAGGKIDIGAATGMPTQKVVPALGGGKPKGTADNPIVLK
jgi:hypothetical protein